MLEFSAWMQRLDLPAKPWLIVAQGPTFACHSKLNLTGYNVLGLDQQAVKAAKQWRFRPGTKDGKAVAVSVTLEMRFTLK